MSWDDLKSFSYHDQSYVMSSLLGIFTIIMFIALNRGFIPSRSKKWILQYFRAGNTTKRWLGLSSNPYNTAMPPKPHITLKAGEIKDKVIIIGDIHGCLDEAKELLVECKHDPNDSTVIFVGDLVNKGPYSAETVKFVRNMCENRQAYCVRGNHDDFVVAVAMKLFQPKSTLPYLSSNELSACDLRWMNELPYTISLPSLNAIVVHAGLIPGIPLEEQTAGNMHSMRNIDEQEEGGQKRLVGSSSDKVGKPWVEYWRQSPHVFFGHDAKRGLQLSDYATGLDTGCVYGKYFEGNCSSSSSNIDSNRQETDRHHIAVSRDY
jgi:predicted phosphodiesterase